MVLSLTDEHILGRGEVRSKDGAGAGRLGNSGCIVVVSIYLAERLFRSCIMKGVVRWTSILPWRSGLASLTAVTFSLQSRMAIRRIMQSYTHTCGTSTSCWNEILYPVPFQTSSSRQEHKHPCSQGLESPSHYSITSLNCWDTRVSLYNYGVCVDYFLADILEWAVTDLHFRSRAAASWPKLTGGRFKSTAWLA